MGFVLLVFSCSSTMHLQPGQYLLQKNISVVGMEEELVKDTTGKSILPRFTKNRKVKIDKDLVYSAIKTKENKRMVFVKTYLHLYNIGVSLQKNDYSFERLFRRFFPENKIIDSIAVSLVDHIGEPPVLIDTTALREDISNVESVYFSRGYFHPQVFCSFDTSNALLNPQKISVTFHVRENDAYILDQVDYVNVTEPSILERIRAVSPLKPGDNYNEDNLVREREQITNVMRNLGYYKFSLSDVDIDLDTLPRVVKGTQPNDKRVKQFKPIHAKVTLSDTLVQYRIGNIRMLIEPAEIRLSDIPYAIDAGTISDSMRKVLNLPRRVLSDSLYLKAQLYDRTINSVNLNFLTRLIRFQPGRLFSIDTERRTQSQLQGIGIFKYVVIQYTVDEATHLIDVQIQTRLHKRYQVKAGLEGFTQNDPVLQSQLPGFGGNISLKDKMLFRSAENFNLSGKGNMSFYRPGSNEGLEVFYELGLTASFTVPRMVAPVFKDIIALKFSPSTSFTLNLKSQQRTEYNRTIFGLNWNYTWLHSSTNQKRRSSLSPYVINLISSRLSPTFASQIQAIDNNFLKQFIALDFSSRFSSRFSYKYTFSDYSSTRARPTQFFQPVFEFGGNTPYLIDRFVLRDGSFTDHRMVVPFRSSLFGQQQGGNDTISYGQFAKVSLEYKLYVPIGKKVEFVWRGFTGVSDPWNYTGTTPFDARFFSGGTTSMRAWQSNTLGPGTFNRNENLSGDGLRFEYLISPGGEVIFETNAELRLNVYKYLELAFFSDAGNVWFLPSSSFGTPSGILSRKNITQLGWDAGVGFRLDFSFLIFRVDIAQQIYAPDLQDFVVKSFPRDLGANRWQVNFGIGYPF